jgi:hypothetical protein
MALKHSATVKGDLRLETKNGSMSLGEGSKQLENCYIKVNSVIGTKSNMSAVVSFTKDDFSFLEQYEFVPDLFGQNFIAQAYEHLKTLPEFAGAVDC